MPPGHIAARDAFRSMRGESEQTVRALLGPELPCVVVATASLGAGLGTWPADGSSQFATYFSPQLGAVEVTTESLHRVLTQSPDASDIQLRGAKPSS